MISMYDLARMARVSVSTVHRDLKQGLFFATWKLIKRKNKRGIKQAVFGWAVSISEANKYVEYRQSLVGFRSDGRLPSKDILKMIDSGRTPEEIAREAKIKPASVLRVKQRANSLRKRRGLWQAQTLVESKTQS